MSTFILQTIMMLVVAIAIVYFVIYNKTSNLEKRISKYCIESKIDNSVPLFDRFSDLYIKIIASLNKVLLKSNVMKNYSEYYTKYISFDKINEVNPIEFVSKKFLILIISISSLILYGIINMKLPDIFDILLVSLIGFFVLDVYFIIYDVFRKRQVERELLNAIIIMNNAFRSGRSTIQAIEIVADELKGPIKQEFKKMHLEISYGLSLDVVFERFSKRVASEEVNYITSSLIILNKTGGNIIKVFSSIEDMLFNKRKIKQEMKSLSSSSLLLSVFLLGMPVGLVLIIMLLNPLYFLPLITTPVGIAILILILTLYIGYIFAVIKVMGVRYS